MDKAVELAKTRQQRRGLIQLYEDLFDKTITVITKKMVIFNKT